MVARHRIPTIFNLSMVDVLCCALGCVILLWLLNLRDAKQRADMAGQTSIELAKTRSLLSASESQASTLDTQLKETAEQRARQTRRADQAEQSSAALQAQLERVESELTAKAREQEETNRELTASRQGIAALGAMVRDKEDEARTAARNLDDLQKRLRDADARLKQSTAQADLVPQLKDDVQGFRERLAAADITAAELRKDLDSRKQELAGAGRTVGTLEDTARRLEREMAALRDEKRALTDQAARVRAAADNRFAGISLTGRRVVFIVDMSGSMELTDESTPAPDKWNEVRQTLGKIMRSMADLTHFQVIVFSNQVQFPLGNEARWLNFDLSVSPTQVVDALGQIKPRGNTDVFAAFQAAFRYRADGLDTIYFFSDGLPNMGPGLSPEAARTMKETERADILAKHVRRTLATDWNRTIPGKPRVRINAVGFFYESPDVGAFLWALTRENDGSFVGMSKP